MKKSNNAWFSIIEILVWVFIFTLGLLSVFLMLQWSVNMNEYSKNEIMAANLAREGLDLVKNTRDTNFAELNAWDIINPNNYAWDRFEIDTYYKVENNFEDGQFGVKYEKINNFDEWKDVINTNMQDYRLYLDEDWKYIYDNWSVNNTATPFYRYIKIEKADYEDSGTNVEVDDALRVICKVIWTSKWYHKVELRTIITDWKKL